VVLAVAICMSIGGTATVAARDDGSTLSAKMDGKAIGADRDGRGTAFIQLKRSKRKVCYSLDASEIEKGRVFIGEGAKGDRGRSVLTLFNPSDKSSRLSGCVRNVSRTLLANLAAHPNQFFVAVSNHKFPHGAIRGQLRASAPGQSSPNYSLTDCYIYVNDDTGDGLDFSTGQPTTPTPIDGTGVRYLAGEDHSETTCIVNKNFDKFPNGTVKVYAKDRLIGSNVYSCVTTGKYKCFGPQPGSTTSGWTLRLFYYVCIPGASQRPYYCPK
jgi:CHRD domain-containing protein